MCDLNSPKISYDSPITYYRNGLPQGNGHIGSLLWTPEAKLLCLSLDRYDIWDLRSQPEVKSKDYTYANLIELVKAGEYDKIAQVFDNFYRAKPTPTKLPVGRVLLDFGSDINSITSELNVANGIAEAKIKAGGDIFEIESFIHSCEKVGLIKISSKTGFCDIKLKCPAFSSGSPEKLENRKHLVVSQLTDLGYRPASYHQEDTCKWFIQQTCEDLAFGIFLAHKQVGSDLYCSYTIATNRDADYWQSYAKSIVQRSLDRDWSQSKREHIKWWDDYNAKSSVKLPNPKLQNLWDMANYFLGSCSRKGSLPMPLQGLWIDDDGKKLPPWKGDYHHDLNTQMCYSHYLMANRISEGRNILDFLVSLRDKAAEFAKMFYDAGGISFPGNMGLDGVALGGWAQYSVSITNPAWLCQLFIDYWNYTEDQEFLKETAYPFLNDIAECICRWLSEDENGKFKLPLSTSPEIHDNTPKAWFDSITNYDLAILKYLFINLSTFSEILNDDQKDKWDYYVQKLPDIAIKDDILMVSKDEMLCESHRHFSNCMAIHPLKLLCYDSPCDRKIIDATILKLEELGTGFWVGFSFVWMSSLYSCQRNGLGSEYQLEIFHDCICGPNGFCLNGDYQNKGVTVFHYDPFTIETNMGAASAVCEMLLQSHQGYIEIFPSIPDSWRKRGVSFQNLRSYGAVCVSSKITDGDIEYVRLQTESKKILKLKNPFGQYQVTDEDGNEIVSDDNNILEITVDLTTTIYPH